MNRKNFLGLALTGLFVAILPKRSKATPSFIGPGIPSTAPAGATGVLTENVIGVDFGTEGVVNMVVKSRAELEEFYPRASTSYNGPDVVQIAPAHALSGVNPDGGIWCQCPHCLGKGFLNDEDTCGYCGEMSCLLGYATSFGMTTREGDAEVFRALVWHEWSESKYFPLGERVAPSLPCMLVNIATDHPEVNDTAVREAVYVWLKSRSGHDVAQAWIEQWSAERKYREEMKATVVVPIPDFRPGDVVQLIVDNGVTAPAPMTVEESLGDEVRCVWFDNGVVYRQGFNSGHLHIVRLAA